MSSEIKADKWSPASGTAGTIGDSGDTFTVPTGVGLTVTDEVKTNKISPASGTAFTIGDSGDTFTVPSGVTFANSGTATGFGELNTPVFKAVLSGGQSIDSATQTTMAFATEQLDTGGCYDTSAYKFTPNVEGYYLFVVCGLIEHANAQNEYGDISVFKNGNKVISNRHANATDNNISSSLMCTGITHMNGSGDYAVASLYHNMGSSRTLDSNEDFTYFTAFRITGSR